MTTETEQSPLAIYRDKLATLVSIQARLITMAEQAVMQTAIDDFRRAREDMARWDEKHFRTRFFCAICYREIPRGEDAPLPGDSRRVHNACGHIYTYAMPATRREIEQGAFNHAPGTCSAKDKCPLLTETPTMGPKRTVFEEPRE